MGPPHDGDDGLVVLMSCRTIDEARMVVYGLDQQGIRARVRSRPGLVAHLSPRRGEKPHEVVLHPEDEARARQALARLWAGRRPRPLRPPKQRPGRCPRCGYDLVGLEKSAVCPECGTGLPPPPEA